MEAQLSHFASALRAAGRGHWGLSKGITCSGLVLGVVYGGVGASGRSNGPIWEAVE